MKRKTYDIQFAGPNNRFALRNGQIVSNSGKGLQPHNFMRGLLKLPQQQRVLRLLELADHEILELMYEWPISTVAQVMRSFIVASAGRIFKVVDYSSIEARVLSWLAEDIELLEAFRKGYDPYKLMAAKLFSTPYEKVTDDQRRIGKNLILGCLGGDTEVLVKGKDWVKITDVRANDLVWDGQEWVRHTGVMYQGVQDVISVDGVLMTSDHEIFVDGLWVNAGSISRHPQVIERALKTSTVPVGTLTGGAARWIVLTDKKRAKTYDITDAGRHSRFTIRTRSGSMIVHNCGYGLGYKKFVGYSEKAGVEITEDFAKTAVRTYRSERRKVVTFWYDIERAAITAVRERRVEKNHVRLRNLKFYLEDSWFCIELPSGRKLRYYRPQVKVVEKFGEPAHQLSYKVEFRGRLISESTYGGKLVENIVQAIARDFMVVGMFKAEEAGYPVIGTVHDELITEPKIGFGSVKELEEVVCELPAWGKGCPIAAKGFESPRYRKD